MEDGFISLSPERRAYLTKLLADPVCLPRQREYLRVVLLLDTSEGAPNYTPQQAAEELGLSLYRIRLDRLQYLEAMGATRRSLKGGSALRTRITPAVQRRLLTLVQSPPPRGNSGWTAKLLATTLINEGTLPFIHPHTVSNALRREGF